MGVGGDGCGCGCGWGWVWVGMGVGGDGCGWGWVWVGVVTVDPNIAWIPWDDHSRTPDLTEADLSDPSTNLRNQTLC